MSSQKRRKQIKNIRNSSPTITVGELEKIGELPKGFDLFDNIEMKEYQLKNKTDWWSRMK